MNEILSLLVGQDGFDNVLILLAHAALNPKVASHLLAALAPVAKGNPEKLLSIAMSAPPETIESFRAAGFLVFEDLGRAAKALGALAGFHESFSRVRSREPSAVDVDHVIDPSAALNEAATKQLLAEIGIASPPERTAKTADAAAHCAAELGFPVVLKILSSGIAHKTEVGGVVLGLWDEKAVAQAAASMPETVAAAAPEARLDGFLVSKMVSGGTECIVGTVKDPVFGPVAMFGLGGVSVEVFGDVTFRLAPVSKTEALRMIREIKGWQLLAGHRGREPADVDSLSDAIVALSGLAASHADVIRSIEINPLLAMPQGLGSWALDAAIQTEAGSDG